MDGGSPRLAQGGGGQERSPRAGTGVAGPREGAPEGHTLLLGGDPGSALFELCCPQSWRYFPQNMSVPDEGRSS